MTDALALVVPPPVTGMAGRSRDLGSACHSHSNEAQARAANCPRPTRSSSRIGLAARRPQWDGPAKLPPVDAVPVRDCAEPITFGIA